mmetsp:Transcript_2838/g.11261  ORF Transcript_2838/g.11261 Transcript_2838/m.11261 type:complete len:207 (+) Transcript_2838:2682-3302(+)
MSSCTTSTLTLFPSVKYSCLRVRFSGSANRGPDAADALSRPCSAAISSGAKYRSAFGGGGFTSRYLFCSASASSQNSGSIANASAARTLPPNTVFPYPAVKHWLPRLFGVTTSNQRQYFAAAEAGTASEAPSRDGFRAVASDSSFFFVDRGTDRRRYAPTGCTSLRGSCSKRISPASVSLSPKRANGSAAVATSGNPPSSFRFASR